MCAMNIWHEDRRKIVFREEGGQWEGEGRQKVKENEYQPSSWCACMKLFE